MGDYFDNTMLTALNESFELNFKAFLSREL